jgi:DNA-binding IclR family transcriptional regulator
VLGLVALATRVPASCTAGARALLVDADSAVLRRLFGGEELPPQGRGGPRDVAELHRRIAAARILGAPDVKRAADAVSQTLIDRAVREGGQDG